MGDGGDKKHQIHAAAFGIHFYRPHTKYREGYVFTVSVLLLTWGGGGGWVSGKMQSKHIVATKVLMPMGGCPGSALCDIYGEEHYFENRLGPPPPPWAGFERAVSYRDSNYLLVMTILTRQRGRAR